MMMSINLISFIIIFIFKIILYNNTLGYTFYFTFYFRYTF